MTTASHTQLRAPTVQSRYSRPVVYACDATDTRPGAGSWRCAGLGDRWLAAQSVHHSTDDAAMDWGDTRVSQGRRPACRLSSRLRTV